MNRTIAKFIRPVLALGLAASLSACASVDRVSSNPSEISATRAAPLADSFGTAERSVAPATFKSYNVTAINVQVPTTLKVSEANRFYPGSDIVWREDPIGDRYAQVKAIISAGLEQGVVNVQGERNVVLDVVLTRFHALTEKARYTVGGVHSIQFTLQIRDAATGEVLEGPRFVKADFDALGGNAAVAAEARGVTQKVRITNQLAYVIQQELTTEKGYVAQELGFMGALNQL